MKAILLTLSLGALAPFAVNVVEAPAPKASAAQEPQDAADAEAAMAEMKAMMAMAEKYTNTGEAHVALGRFVGDWKVTASGIMGGEAMSATAGKAKVDWKIEGRWLEGTYEGEVMPGMPGIHHMWLGYDNMKKSYVYSDISSWDTAMKTAEGDMTREGDALVLYGTLDEYLTGEHDKMVKYVWRFESEDKMVLGVHDLAIGLENTEVLRFTYERM